MKDTKSLPLGWQLAHEISDAEAGLISGGVSVTPALVDCKYWSAGASYGGNPDVEADWGVDF